MRSFVCHIWGRDSAWDWDRNWDWGSVLGSVSALAKMCGKLRELFQLCVQLPLSLSLHFYHSLSPSVSARVCEGVGQTGALKLKWNARSLAYSCPQWMLCPLDGLTLWITSLNLHNRWGFGCPLPHFFSWPVLTQSGPYTNTHTSLHTLFLFFVFPLKQFPPADNCRSRLNEKVMWPLPLPMRPVIAKSQLMTSIQSRLSV